MSADIIGDLTIAEAAMAKEGHIVHNTLRRAREEIEKLRAALTRIAAYDDGLASDRLATNGSYGAFDEPGSVRVARAALEGREIDELKALREARDLLLPGLASFAPDVECDLILDIENRKIDLLVWRSGHSTQRHPLFTADEIKNGSYKREFYDRARAVIQT